MNKLLYMKDCLMLRSELRHGPWCRWTEMRTNYLNVMDAVHNVRFPPSTSVLETLPSISTLRALNAASCSEAACPLQISPTTLFFIEGMAQSPIQMCWGDGFVTDAGLIAQYGLSDPRPFFDDLLQRPYLNNVVISPHYYGPSVSQQTFK